MVPTDHLQVNDETPASEPGLPSSASDSSDIKRLERDRRRLAQARASLERLYLEMRQDLQESERRSACATVRIRLLLRDAERRDREFASARRRVRILSNDAEQRDREFASARRRVRILLKDAERRDRELASVRHRIKLLLDDSARRDRDARRRIRLLQRDGERRDREYAAVRAQLRTLKHLSAGLATGFLAVTASRRWRLGNALGSLPDMLLGRRPKTAANDLRPLATSLALGQTPPTSDSPGPDQASPATEQ